MNRVEVVSVDLGKQCFHAIEFDSREKEILRKKLTRATLLPFFANLDPCTVVMEACGGAHFLARELIKLGHTPKLIAAKHVKPMVKSNKNDFADAEAIYEARKRPNIHFVSPKTEAQQAQGLLITVRDAFVKDRIATSNRIHCILLEIGIALSASHKSIRELPVLLDQKSIAPAFKMLLLELHSHFNYLEAKVKDMDRQIKRQAAEDDLARRLMTIPGVGPITSSVLASELGDGKQYKCGRDYSASIGLVPKQYTTGGKPRLLGISKRGDPNQRRLLIQCARVYLIALDRQKGALADWVRQLLSRHHSNHVVCALANKLGRIAWAIAANHSEFDAGPSAMSA